MKRIKKLHKYNMQLLKERLLFYSILLFLLIFTIGFFVLEDKISYSSKDITLYTGKIGTINYAANLVDNAYNGENIVISPFNINIALSILYNGAENNTSYVFKNYFNKNINNQNDISYEKLLNIKNIPKDNNDYVKYYNNLINEMFNLKYDELTLKDIIKLDRDNKENLILILKKIKLLERYFDGEKDIELKKIEKYILSKDEINESDNDIFYGLESVLDYYESYNIDNKVINYNKIYFNKDIYKEKINSNFKKILESYNSYIEEYTNSSMLSTMLDINSEIKNNTDNNITRFVSQDELEKNFLMLNSLYFNNKWEKNFEFQNIKEEEFYDSNENISIVEMMSEVDNFYLENSYAKGFIKNFANNKYSFIGILPKNTGDFLLSSLNLDSLLVNKKENKVLISLPKFSYQSVIDLKKVLKSDYNLRKIFDKNANYSKISEDKMDISLMKQKLFIKIAEKGTVESKLSKTKVENSVILDLEEKLTFNRPFAYIIINNETKDVMLIGKVVDL